MVGPYQELTLANQPGWILAKESVKLVPCPRPRTRGMASKLPEVDGTVVVRLYMPPQDLLVQRTFPLVLSEWVANHRCRELTDEYYEFLRAISCRSSVVRPSRRGLDFIPSEFECLAGSRIPD